MLTTVIEHSLLAERLSVLRDKHTTNADFKVALHEASVFLMYEAMRNFRTERYELDTPLSRTTGTRLAETPIVVPVLRAGLGMLGAATALLRNFDTGFVGVSKDGFSERRNIYLAAVPPDLRGRRAIVLDPMLAAGHTMIRVCDELIRRNCGNITMICLLGATAGVERVAAAGYDADLFIAAIDAELNDVAFIVPGLGDAGDRQFGEW
ncbi:uracil phosphoribosyltransferase [Dactylosporangium sp. NPDC005572]|uniref:uracil phosphoribosyltransferase n=1 Tax=Dactylosporangium sp. NPDC005572 TaxID=3156889 RepID=UPI0033A1B908